MVALEIATTVDANTHPILAKTTVSLNSAYENILKIYCLNIHELLDDTLPNKAHIF